MTNLAKLRIVEREGRMLKRFAKLSWNAVYYSYDGGATWHKSRSAAYAAAKTAGTLQDANDTNAPCYVQRFEVVV